MDRNECSPKLDDLRPVDGRLQPAPMMESRVPIPDRGVVFTKRHLEVVVVVVANDRALDIELIGIGLRGEADFTEIADFLGQWRSKVQHELPQIETAYRTFLVRCRKVYVAETPDLERRIVDLRLPLFDRISHMLGVRSCCRTGTSLHRFDTGSGLGTRVSGRSCRSLFAFMVFQFGDPFLQLFDTR